MHQAQHGSARSALWRPMEQAVFERFEHRHERDLLERLARIPVEFRVLVSDA